MYIDKDYIKDLNVKLNEDESINEKTYWIKVMNRHKVFTEEDAHELIKSLEESTIGLNEDQKEAIGKAYKVFTGKTLT